MVGVGDLEGLFQPLRRCDGTLWCGSFALEVPGRALSSAGNIALTGLGC